MEFRRIKLWNGIAQSCVLNGGKVPTSSSSIMQQIQSLLVYFMRKAGYSRYRIL